MSTLGLIREHVKQVLPEQLFTTRDLLNYGKRKNVDDAVYYLVKTKQIVRVVPGVFHRPDRQSPVTPLEIATVKAKSFGRVIVQHAKDVGKKLGLLDESPGAGDHWFAVGARSSSFKFGAGRIHFKSTSLRNMLLGDSPLGQVIRALCYLGRKNVSQSTIAVATKSLKPSQKEKLRKSCAFMPAWLSDFFHGASMLRTKTPVITGITILPATLEKGNLPLTGEGVVVSEPCKSVGLILRTGVQLADYRARTVQSKISSRSFRPDSELKELLLTNKLAAN